MLLFSETSLSFTKRVREEIRAILNTEVNKYYPISMPKSRLLYKEVSYPLSIVVFEDNTRLGYFDYRFLELGLSKKLMYTAQDAVLKNIIRHEIAHYISYLLHGPIESHGHEFREICRTMNWDMEVEKAYANIEILNENLDLKNETTDKLLTKLKKLMALATSDNIHEAENATLKANQLLLEHNLTYIKDQQNEDEFVLKRVLSSTRKQVKHDAIYQILQTFYVTPVMNHGNGLFYLEVTGDETSVLLAEYVAHFLDYEIDQLWKNAQKENAKLKGMASKNSFIRGIALGFVMKLNEVKKKSASPTDLAIIDQRLIKQKNIAYRGLRTSSSPAPKNDPLAKSLGIEKGRNLSIKPGISSSVRQIFLLN